MGWARSIFGGRSWLDVLFDRSNATALGGEERILIPLQQNLVTTTEEERLAVRLIYSQRLPKLDRTPKIRLTLPKVINIKEIGQVNWTLHAPNGYIYKFSGNVTRTAPLAFEEYQAQPVSYSSQGRQAVGLEQRCLTIGDFKYQSAENATDAVAQAARIAAAANAEYVAKRAAV